ncbi:hypothetical protein BST61_g89 [Cercospora zeina]
MEQNASQMPRNNNRVLLFHIQADFMHRRTTNHPTLLSFAKALKVVVWKRNQQIGTRDSPISEHRQTDPFFFFFFLTVASRKSHRIASHPHRN